MIVVLNRTIHMLLSNFFWFIYEKESWEHGDFSKILQSVFVFQLQYNDGTEGRRQWEKWDGERGTTL